MSLPISEEEKDCFLRRIYVLYAKHGFSKISMDKVAGQLHTSKATLYKYFQSKEDLIRTMIREIVSHVDALSFSTEGGIRGVLSSFSEIYSKGILTAACFGPEFEEDLREKTPEICSFYLQGVDRAKKRFYLFYEEGLQKGYFRELPLPLFIRQCLEMLPLLGSESDESREGMTMCEAIREYYRMLLYQILDRKYLYAIESEQTVLFVEPLVRHLESDRFFAAT